MRVADGTGLDVGVYSSADLARRGYGARGVAALVSTGRLRRLTRGWFAIPSARSDAVWAVSVGGRLGCVSAAAAYGLWVPPGRETHVVLTQSRTLPPFGSDLLLHRLEGRLPAYAVCNLPDALAQVIRRHDAETSLMILESAVYNNAITVSLARELIAGAPIRQQRGMRLFMPGAESGTETRLRLFFQRRGLSVRSQVVIAGVGRVDLLVGRSLIVEADSAAHHSADERYRNDRRRDLEALRQGYAVVRVGYHQAFYEWESTQEALKVEVATRRYLRPPSNAA